MFDNIRIKQAYEIIQFMIDQDYGLNFNRFFHCTTLDNTKPLYTNSVEKLLQLIEANNHGQVVKPTKLTTSSGGVLILIFKNFVIKIFDNYKTWLKVTNVLRQTYKSNYIIKITYFISDNHFHAISTEKLVPIVYYDKYGSHLIKKFDHKLVLKLFWNISHALQELHELGFEQGDCTWDNIGEINNRFVLFDFNCVHRLRTYSNSSDISQLIRSSKFNLTSVNKYPTEQRTFDFLKILQKKELKNGHELYNFLNFTFKYLKPK